MDIETAPNSDRPGNGFGWVKLYRSLLDHPRFSNGDWLKLWLWLLLKATHQHREVVFGGRRITLRPGQLITSRQKLSEHTGIEVSKVERLLKMLQNERQIEQQSSNISRLLTIIKWDVYQRSEQPNNQRINRERTADEHLVNTNKKGKNAENEQDSIAVSHLDDSNQLFTDDVVDSIYQAFPRKQGKRSALREIRKALVRIDKLDEGDAAEWLLRRVHEYTQSVRATRPEFVKMPDNWFRDEYYFNNYANSPSR